VVGPHTATTAPGPALHELRRERLLDLLHEQSSRALVLLIAPAGFGKSTLAAAYSRESGSAVAWVTVEPGDGDVRVLFARIGQALEAAFPTAGTLPNLERGLAAGADGAGLARLLQADLAHAPSRFILVLDDYHLVQDANAVHSAVDVLVRGLPDFGQIVVTSREPPPLSIHQLVVNDAVVVLGIDDLRFTPDETTALRRQLGGDPARDLEADGWVAGILLGGAPRQLGLGGTGPLETYVEREVLGRLGGAEQRWLEALAVLEVITPAASGRLLGSGNWKARLSGIAERCPFLAVGVDGTYRLHALVRAALIQRLRRARGRRARRVWSIARQLAEERQDLAGAVRACQELGDLESAVALVRHVAELRMEAGRWPAVLSALSLIPEAERRSHPDLSLVEAHALVQSGLPAPARESAEAALERAAYASDVGLQIRALLELANIGRYEGDLSAANDWLVAADYLLVHSALPSSERRSLDGRLLGLRGVCLAIRGQVADAREALEAAQRMLSVDGNSRELAVVQNNLGAFCIRAGDYRAGRAALAASTGHWRAVGDRVTLATTQLLLGNLDLRLGDLEAAGAALSHVMEEARLAGATRIEGFGSAALGAWHRANGRVQDAAEWFEASLRLAQEVGEPELLVRALRQRAEMAILQNDLELAARLLTRAQTSAQRSGPTVDLAAIERTLGRLQLAAGDAQRALAHLDAALGVGREAWEPDEFAVTLYWLGTAQLLIGEAHLAETSLREALQTAESSVGLSVLATAAAEDERLVRFGQQIGVGRASLATIERLAARRRPLSSLPRVVAAPVVRAPPRIEARLFGAFILHLNGQRLEVGGRRDRATELLALLLLHPDGLAARSLAELLWPDMTRERSLHNLRMTVYLLRTMLGGKTAVRYAALAYRLDPSLTVWADIYAFDAAISRARKSAGEVAVRSLDEALGLYRGPLVADTGWRWVEPFREEYRARAADALLRLALLIAPDDPVRSDTLAEQVLTLDPDNRTAYEQLLRNARVRRDPVAARDLAERYRAMLHKAAID
jgi:DNA-binding SARP family transcriptional activator